MVGSIDRSTAKEVCSSGLPKNLTSSIAASGFSEYCDTISCQPPSVAALRAPSPLPIGSGATPTLPATAGASWLDAHMYGQLRAKAALPAVQTLRVSVSRKVV